MRIAVELSLYPFKDQPVPPIARFIERLNAHPGLEIVTNAMSTQVAGDFRAVFAALEAEIERTFDEEGRAVVVMKVLGGSY